MRHRNKAVRAFFADYRHYREIAELHQALDDVTKALGFCYFALLHHAHPAQSNTLLVHLHNYPPDWASRYAEEQLYRYDPVLEACSRTNIGFSWDEIDTLIRMTPRLRFTIDSAQENGLGNGFTVPAYVPGEPLGSCSFVTAAGVALPRDSLHIAELVGSFAFAAARRINASSTNSQRGYAALTPRQRDCVYWLSQGKTAWEIGVILGISQETVTQHLNMACARYGVGKRVPMVIKALYGGEIGFLDVIG